MASDDATTDGESFDEERSDAGTTDGTSEPVDRRPTSGDRSCADSSPVDSTAALSESKMLARTWQIAHGFREPADYEIPTLPVWRVRRDDDGALAFAAADAETPFIVAENPVPVRR